MCRLAAYCGPSIPLENIVIKPAHSLVVQSQVAEEAKLAVNGDGFGLAWYGSPAGTVHDPNMQPALYKEIMPAWANPNLLHLCRAIAAPVFLAHVRASTFGGASYQNCHPFTHGRWSFVHNGQIGGFGRLRRQLEGLLPDDLFAARLGITDSELLFLLMVSCNLEADPRQACRSAIEKIHALWREIPAPDRTALRLTFVLTDGETLYGCRYSSDGRAPTLYVCEDLDHGGVVLASEPLDGNAYHWRRVEEATIVSVNQCGGTSHLPIGISQLAA